MRLLLLIRDLDLGGAQRQMVHVATGLVDRGHYVTVVCWRGGGALGGELRARRIQVTECRSAWRGNLFGLARKVRGVLRAERIDIMYCMMPVENLVGLLASLGGATRLVWGIRTSRDALRHLPLSQRALFMLQRALARSPNAIIANSASGADLVPRSRLGQKVVVIKNGTDTVHFHPDESSRDQARERLGVKSNAFAIAMVGRIEAQKGLEEFLEAIKEIVKVEPRVAAMLVGRVAANYGSVVNDLIRSLRLECNVMLMPQQSEVHSVYVAADVLVSPSLGEGMSNVVAEAMASGLAVVATRVGENESLIGPAGWLVAPGDIEALKAAIVAAMQADRRALGVMARSRIESMFSVRGLVDQTESVLNRVLNEQ